MKGFFKSGPSIIHKEGVSGYLNWEFVKMHGRVQWFWVGFLFQLPLTQKVVYTHVGYQPADSVYDGTID